MHDVGVGHLDVKPSNIVLRRAGQPVLVDFGLAGRHIRPGCATGLYGAPEVWGAFDGQEELPPAKADVYAFACVAFEALTGELLFDAPSEMAQIAMHLSHDGSPEPLKALAERAKRSAPAVLELAELLSKALRHHPRDRPTAATVRKALARLTPVLARGPWPIIDVS
jgi:serine/threonine protein kinase